jgi:hypothetical protein
MVGVSSSDHISTVWEKGILVDGRFTLLNCLVCDEDVVLWRAYDNVEQGTRILVEHAPGQCVCT